MIIEKETPCVFLRIPNFNRKTDIVNEHIKVLNKYKKVFLMKMGRGIKNSFLEKIYEENGYLILKNASKYGNKFYICHIEKIKDNEKYVYPEYYNDIFEGMGISFEKAKKESMWLKIVSMTEVDEQVISNFKTLTNKKSVFECAMKLFQVSIMYGSAEKRIEVKKK